MRLFFASSDTFHDQFTALGDLINPTAAAMWNMRWQVRGYVEERGSVSEQELHNRFVIGSGVGSANIRRHCLEGTWDQQIGEVSLLVLFGAVGLYEGWTSGLEVGTETQRERLQHASQGIGGRNRPGVRETVAALQATPSPSIDASYGTVLRRNHRYLPTRLDDMLLIYRCFKEIRNVCAHAGRIPDDKAIDAYANAVSSGHGLGRRGSDLELPRVSRGIPIELSLVNVQNFCALLLSIVITLDAELAVTKAGEAWFLDRWEERYGFRQITGHVSNRGIYLREWSLELGLPRPGPITPLYDLLKSSNLVL